MAETITINGVEAALTKLRIARGDIVIVQGPISRDELDQITTMIRKSTMTKNLVICVPDEVSITNADEDYMKGLGWVRSKS